MKIFEWDTAIVGQFGGVYCVIGSMHRGRVLTGGDFRIMGLWEPDVMYNYRWTLIGRELPLHHTDKILIWTITGCWSGSVGEGGSKLSLNIDY